jgi:hypothetical protein
MANELKRDAVGLPAPVDGVVTQLADRGAGRRARRAARARWPGRYSQEVLRECQAIVGNRYPFVTSSTADVPLADFGRLFGYNGVYDGFFTNDLRDVVDTNRRPGPGRPTSLVLPSAEPSRWGDRAGTADQGRVRQGGLPGSGAPVPHDLQLPGCGTQAFLLEVDGQSLEDRHGAERAVQAVWPGPSPGAATVTFEERSDGGPIWAPADHGMAAARGRGARRARDGRALSPDLLVEGHEAKVSIDALTIRISIRQADAAAVQLQLTQHTGPWVFSPTSDLRQAAQSRRLPAAAGVGEFVRVWGPVASGESGCEPRTPWPINWLDRYLTGPVWRFAFAGGVAGPAPVIGCWRRASIGSAAISL